MIEQNPSLVLVPRTNGDSDAGVLLGELAKVIRESDVRVINFTHYGFLNENLPTKEVTTFLRSVIESDFGKARVAFIDIDSKFCADIAEMLEVARHGGRLGHSDH